MDYLVIGAGGTGGSIAAYLAVAGHAVTVVDREPGLKAIREHGLTVCRYAAEKIQTRNLTAVTEAEYQGQADVIFVCVKGYSLLEIIPLLSRAAHPQTVIIPILNIYGAGEKLAQQLPELNITEGCIYIAAEISGPGEILHRGSIFRVIFGSRDPAQRLPRFDQIASDLRASGIDGQVADDIRSAAFHKFALVSSMAAAGAYLNASAGDFQQPGSEARELFVTLIKEIQTLGQAMGIYLQEDLVEDILITIDALAPAMTTSMQKDLSQGGASEIDGLVFEVPRLGERWGTPVPQYTRISQALIENL